MSGAPVLSSDTGRRRDDTIERIVAFNVILIVVYNTLTNHLCFNVYVFICVDFCPFLNETLR